MRQIRLLFALHEQCSKSMFKWTEMEPLSNRFFFCMFELNLLFFDWKKNMLNKELLDFVEIFLGEHSFFFNHTYSIRTVLPCFSEGFKKSHFFKRMAYVLTILIHIYGYMQVRFKVASYCQLFFTKGKSLLRAVRRWTARARSYSSERCAAIWTKGRILALYILIYITNKILAPHKFSETQRDSTGKYRTLLLSPQWKAEL